MSNTTKHSVMLVLVIAVSACNTESRRQSKALEIVEQCASELRSLNVAIASQRNEVEKAQDAGQKALVKLQSEIRSINPEAAGKPLTFDPSQTEDIAELKKNLEKRDAEDLAELQVKNKGDAFVAQVFDGTKHQRDVARSKLEKQEDGLAAMKTHLESTEKDFEARKKKQKENEENTARLGAKAVSTKEMTQQKVDQLLQQLSLSNKMGNGATEIQINLEKTKIDIAKKIGELSKKQVSVTERCFSDISAIAASAK